MSETWDEVVVRLRNEVMRGGGWADISEKDLERLIVGRDVEPVARTENFISANIKRAWSALDRISSEQGVEAAVALAEELTHANIAWMREQLGDKYVGRIVAVLCKACA